MADAEVCQSVYIPCLVGSVQLQAECDAQGVKLGEETRKYLVYGLLKSLGASQSQKLISKFASEGLINWDEDLYEVEAVLDHYNDPDGQCYFLIKWFGWSHEHDTWEPKSNLDCNNLLEEYLKSFKGKSKRKQASLVRPAADVKKRRIDEIFDKLVSSKVMTTMTPMEMINYCSPIKKKAQIKGLISAQGRDLSWNLKVKEKIRFKKNALRTKEYHKAALQEWEKQLNDIARGFDCAPIVIVNNVDLEGPPDTFVYINNCKEGPGVTIPKDPLVGCECEDCYDSRHSCCAVDSGSKFAYTKKRRVRLPQGTPIYECNSRCKCGTDCLNRVVQRGRKVKICIFRTANGRGWGVKTLQKVKKGTFVMEYVGEVISHEEAERRGREYDAAGRTYLFDLDFTDTDAPFTVDAGKYGNAAHFINHSCDPNLEVFCVWIDTLDPRLPRICLFAKRDIDKNEEITFDYMCGQPTGSDHELTDTSCDDSKLISSESPLPPRSDKGQGQMLNDVDVPGGSLSPSVPPKTDLLISTPVTVDSPEKKISPVGKTSNYSMVCQCGAKNCRKYLF